MPAATPDQVILVDQADTPLGSADRFLVHQDGLLHRAFSVFAFGEPGLLLQQRASDKYHSPGLWSNACCGHPRPGEATEQAAERRLREEMGISCDLRDVTQLVYRLEVGGGLVEHELDHVLVGCTAALPRPDPTEVAQWHWTVPRDLHEELLNRPERYTAWLPLVWNALLRWSSADGHHDLDPVIRNHLSAMGSRS
ncbi:MAG: isopentenyl-diphosphate Delta-isomerase [Gemmatimonadales bacterium]